MTATKPGHACSARRRRVGALERLRAARRSAGSLIPPRPRWYIFRLVGGSHREAARAERLQLMHPSADAQSIGPGRSQASTALASSLALRRTQYPREISYVGVALPRRRRRLWAVADNSRSAVPTAGVLWRRFSWSSPPFEDADGAVGRQHARSRMPCPRVTLLPLPRLLQLHPRAVTTRGRLDDGIDPGAHARSSTSLEERRFPGLDLELHAAGTRSGTSAVTVSERCASWDHVARVAAAPAAGCAAAATCGGTRRPRLRRASALRGGSNRRRRGLPGRLGRAPTAAVADDEERRLWASRRTTPP